MAARKALIRAKKKKNNNNNNKLRQLFGIRCFFQRKKLNEEQIKSNLTV